MKALKSQVKNNPDPQESAPKMKEIATSSEKGEEQIPGVIVRRRRHPQNKNVNQDSQRNTQENLSDANQDMNLDSREPQNAQEQESNRDTSQDLTTQNQEPNQNLGQRSDRRNRHRNRNKTDRQGDRQGSNHQNDLQAKEGLSSNTDTEEAYNISSNEQAEQKNGEGKPENRSRRSRDRRRRAANLRNNAPVAKVISRPGDATQVQPVVRPTVSPAVIVLPPHMQQQIAKQQASVHKQQKAVEASQEKIQENAVEKMPEKLPVLKKEVEQLPENKDTAKPEAENRSNRNKIQPSASARPEGSSLPTLVSQQKRSSNGKGENEERRSRHEKKRRQIEQTPPQVRIISRPDPNAVPVVKTIETSRLDRDRDRDRDGGRERNREDNYRQRQNQGSRPYRQGGRSSQQQQQAVNTGFAGLPTPEKEGQSKKKRNKRRTVDFQNEVNISGRRMHNEEEEKMIRPNRTPRRRPKNRPAPQPTPITQPIKAAKRKIRVEESIRVADMAHQMGLKANEIIKVLLNLGIMATINKSLDLDTAAVVASEFGYEVEKVGFTEEDYLGSEQQTDKPEELKLRPPVVTIMGHVDHGKTSLLDAIRKTHVTSDEAGGITQHIGAYHVKTNRGEIVFLDTPGHEAFTAMRARGAQVTDIVVLVVAADDGVMEQTREAVNHSRAAHVPIMVAVNKIDKPHANPDRVLRELSEIGLVPEDWGGDTVVAKVSAKTREGLDEFLEVLALQAEILELKANPNKPARGHIVEAKLDKGRGPIATVLIQDGTLHQGDNFVCGVFSGRVRAMFNDQGRKVKEAGPSIPVEVQGFEGVPEAGEEFICLTDEKLARRIAESRATKQREKELAKESRVTLETFLAQSSDDTEAKILNLVIKADVQGSLEAIQEALKKLSTDKVKINIIHGGTGAITESDILLASASNAIILGFNIRPTAKVKEIAEHENVDIRFYDIIYKLVDEIKSAMAGLLAPISREVYLGQAEVRQTFNVPKVGMIAGCNVIDGKITRTAGVRLLRDGVVIYTGKILSLRRFKDDVKEVLKGYECGIGLENFNDIKISDVLEAFETVEEAATL